MPYSEPVNRSKPLHISALKLKVKNFDDMQRLRIQSLGRVQKHSNDVQLSLEDKAYFEKLGKELMKLEKDALKEVQRELNTYPIYTKYLKNICGVGPTMAGVLVSEFDIHKATTVSKMWSFAGLNVIDGKAPKPKKGEKLPYNSWLRSKLVGVLADIFIKMGEKCEYSKLYYNYKQRKEQLNWGGIKQKDGTIKSAKGHRHNAAKRYMIKIFLIDLWKKWREMENLPTRPTYQEQYLGHIHKGE